MNNESLYEAMGNINEKHIRAAHAPTTKKKPVWLKWGAMAACLALAVGGIFNLYVKFIPQKSEDPLAGGFVGKVVEIVDERHCIVEATAGDHNVWEGETAHVFYNNIVRNSEIYDSELVNGDTVVITYDSIQIRKDNEHNIITVDSVELLTEIDAPEG